MSAPEQEKYAGMTTEELFGLYREAPSDEVKWEIVMRHMGVVKSIALQVQGVYTSFAQLDDIIDEGLIVLAKAVDKYDPSIGKFETYVAKRIRGMIIDLARQQDWVPRPIRKRAKEIDRLSGELYHKLGRFPSEQEMAENLGISESEYQELLANSSVYSLISLEEALEGYEQISIQEEMQTEGLPDQQVEYEELLETLAKAIGSLRKNEQIVLGLYYQKEMKMKDIATVLGVSHARASQIHTRAIQKLRTMLEDR